MIEIRDVSKDYGHNRAIEGINITVETGSIHGIIGENGSGKTTLLKCITGIYKPNNGSVLIDNENVYENDKVKAKIGYVADYNQYFPSYKVKKMIQFYQGIYKEFDKMRFYELNNVFRIDINKKVSELSKGQKMRLAFMLNMAIYPEIFILDEPTSGLDAIAKRELFNLLIEDVEKRGTTVVISSHNLSELEKVCDSITIIKNGQMYADNTIEELKGEYRKLQVVIPEREASFKDMEDIIIVERIGSIYTIICNSNDNTVVSRLREKGAEFIEEVDMTLEELFVYSSKGGK